jgi:hypothetical protein
MELKSKQAAMMACSLDNLANAVLQKKDTVEQLVSANECLAKALANANAAIACLHIPAAAAAPAGSSGDRPAHWTPTLPKWDSTSYCWSHRFKVKCGHSGTTCANCKEEHVTTDTQSDTKGSSGANKT